MDARFVELKWAPEPTSARVNEIAEHLIDDGVDTFIIGRATKLVKEGRSEAGISLDALASAFSRVIGEAGNEHHYSFVTAPLKATFENNCAVRVTEHMSRWDTMNCYRAGETVKSRDGRRTLEVARMLVRSEHEQSVDFHREKRNGVTAWSLSVRNELRERRINTLKAVKCFTLAQLRKFVALFGNYPSEDDLAYMATLLFHPQILKFKKKLHYEILGPRCHRNQLVLRTWFGLMLYYVALNTVDGDLQFGRLFEVFGDFWDNTNLDFARDWETDIFLAHRVGFYRHTIRDTVNDALGQDDFESYRECYFIDVVMRSNNVAVLKAMFAHEQVDNTRLIKVIEVRMAQYLTLRLHNSYVQNASVYRLSRMTDEMRLYLFTRQLHKTALKPASLALEPPAVMDLEQHINHHAALFGVDSHGDPGPSPDERRLQAWNAVAAEERGVWVPLVGWAFLRQALKRHCIAWFLWDHKFLRPTMRAEMDEDGRPLMTGAGAARDERGFHEGGHEGIEAASAAAAACQTVADTPIDAEEAREMARMQRNAIAASERLAAANAPKMSTSLGKRARGLSGERGRESV
jgi:hypothetical protein